MWSGIFKVFIIAVISGGIAYLGNKLGRYVGRKKLTIFNIRPRITSNIFTILTGSLISILTILVSILLSTNVKTALFEMEKLREEQQTLVTEIYDLKAQKDLAEMNLLTEIEIVFSANETIEVSSIKPAKPGNNEYRRKEIKKQVDQALSKANEYSIRKNNALATKKMKWAKEPGTRNLDVDEEIYDKIINSLLKSKKEMVLVIYAVYNTFIGYEVKVNFYITSNDIIYRPGDIITKAKINGSQNRDSILMQLDRLIQDVRYTALKKGVLPDPETNRLRGGLSVFDLVDVVEMIQSYRKDVEVEIKAKNNIFVWSPFEVQIEILPLY